MNAYFGNFRHVPVYASMGRLFGCGSALGQDGEREGEFCCVREGACTTGKRYCMKW